MAAFLYSRWNGEVLCTSEFDVCRVSVVNKRISDEIVTSNF